MNPNRALMNGARMRTSAIPVQRTMRPNAQRILTSFKPGLSIPVMAIPLLREDSVAGAAFRIAFEMKETVEVLMNAVNARVLTYLVPNTALDRFDGMDSINKSYEGVAPMEGQPVVPWFEQMDAPATHGGNAILKKMGKHTRPGTKINTHYIEAYNQIWNFRARNRSKDITLRDRLDATLAPAFWLHENFAHIVPDFDQAAMDGSVPLSITNARLPVKGIGIYNAGTPGAAALPVKESDGSTVTYPANKQWTIDGTAGAGYANMLVRKHPTAAGNFPDIFAELQDNGISISLANIEMAKKTQAFAKLREQYDGHDDEYIIDLLMQGIQVPEQAWNQPILLGDQRTVFGMSKRYASDGDNLTESVVNGMTMIEQRFRCPPVNMGGVIMMIVEVMPEQLFERQKDPYLHMIDKEKLPNFLRDTLDPEKVVIVKNDEVDIDHTNPNATFGYAPLNHEWARNMPGVGGKFFRPKVNAPFDQDRQKIWAVETVDPVLSKDFYLCTTMHQKPFVETDAENFEVNIRGEAAIRGLTVFGDMLIEANGNYAAIEEEQPRDRIDKDAAP